MLGLPSSTEIRKQIPKDAFLSKMNVKGRERDRFDKQIHSIIIRSLISPESTNLDSGKDVTAIYVMEVQLNVRDYDEANLFLLDRMGHKTIYLLSYGDESKVAVIESVLLQSEWAPPSEQKIHLDGLNLDEVWANTVRSIGNLPRDVSLKEAVSEVKRRREYDMRIDDLERKFRKEKQNHEKRRLHSLIQKLKTERDTKPEHVEDPVPQKPQMTEGSVRGGVSVTRRIHEVQQPPGGFIDPRIFKEEDYEDGVILGDENVHPSIVGLAVDYLTRFSMGVTAQQAFQIPTFGGIVSGRPLEVIRYIMKVEGLDDDSIENACRACMFDSYFRAGVAPKTEPRLLSVDHQTCENIRIMVDRSKRFLESHGPVTIFGPHFPEAYTEIVATGDGDYVTESTVWDFKVSKNPPTKEHTLQLAMYYIMGKHSTDERFQSVGSIGLFNPRLNKAYVLDVADVPKEIMTRIEVEVIGYDESDCLEW